MTENLPSVLSVCGLFTVDTVTDVCAFNVDSDPLVNRARITALKDKLLDLDDGQIDFPVEHELLDGMYLRKLFIPKGSILVGKIHKKSCMNIVASGDISVMTETGTKRIKAGYTLCSLAGIQKVGYAHEDTVFINVFRTDETEIDKIEAEIACESYEDLKAIGQESMVKICQ